MAHTPGEEPKVEGVDESLIITWRDMPPSHYILKIKSLSSILDKTGLDKYESNGFDADGNRWQLLLYHVRDQEKEGSGHLSLNLKCLTQTVYAVVIFFLYDQIKDKYLSIQETRVREFTHWTEGHSRQLVLLDFFRDASNGFVIKDSCVFGVEVFIIRGGRELRGCFRTLREQSKTAYVWRVQISQLRETVGHFSPTIPIGNFKWKIHTYRNISNKKDYLAICLCLQDLPKLPSGLKMHVQFKLSINDNKNTNQKVTKTGNSWFSALEGGWGFPRFIEMDAVERLKSGDVIEIELQIISISMDIYLL